MNVDNKVMSRIRKLLAMAEASESPQEAQIAAAKAHAMLKEYNLTAVDVELTDSEVQKLTFETGLGTLSFWVINLTNVIGRAFNCKTFTQTDYTVDEDGYKYKRVRNIHFVGIDNDVQVANYMFGYMFRYLRSSMKRVKGRGAKNEFATGFGIGLEKRLKEEFPTPSELKAKEGALVIAKDAKIKDFVKNEWSKVGKSANRKEPKRSKYMVDGMKDAENCPLYQAMNPDEGEQLKIA